MWKKTGKTIGFFSFLAWILSFGLLSSQVVFAQSSVSFSAIPDRKEITMDESVSLVFEVDIEGTSARIGEPQFQTNDFDVVNTFRNQSFQQYFINGSITLKTSYRITKVLRPRKKGTLRISQIQIQVGKEQKKAPDVTIRVTPGGAGTPPPPGYGSGSTLRNSGKRLRNKDYFIRAEVSKSDVYKGEQILVTYYLYRRVPIFDITPMEYPALKGFLKEEISLPGGNRIRRSEDVVLDGVPYKRLILGRYAAYPLEAGQLTIDALEVRFQYTPSGGSRRRGDPNSVFNDPFLNFFQRRAPRQAVEKSPPLKIQVKDLPADTKPSGFSGGVGDFELVPSVNKVRVEQNQSVTFKLKVEGRGNLSAIQEPTIQWPKGLELFESKSYSNSGNGGIGEKVFEYLLIPRQSGRFEIPSIDMVFFDPDLEKYVVKTTEPIALQVSPQSGRSRVKKSTTPVSEDESAGLTQETSLIQQGIRYLKIPGEGSSFNTFRILFGANLLFGVLGFLLFLFYFIYQRYQKQKEEKKSHINHRLEKRLKQWNTLSQQLEKTTVDEYVASMTQLKEFVVDVLESEYSASARSLSRPELKRVLFQFIDDTELWEAIEALLECEERLRYAGSGQLGPQESVRNLVEKWRKKGSTWLKQLYQYAPPSRT